MFCARWDGSTLTPVGHYGLSAARESMEPGDVVIVEVDHPRSQTSHKHQFAAIHEAWKHLPEAVMFEDWAVNSEIMRKYALIKCGFYEQAIIDCESPNVARAVADQVREARKKADGYAVAVVRGSVAVIRWPQSQSMRAMGGKRFQESKMAILQWVAQQIGVTPEQLERNAG